MTVPEKDKIIIKKFYPEQYFKRSGYSYKPLDQ